MNLFFFSFCFTRFATRSPSNTYFFNLLRSQNFLRCDTVPFHMHNSSEIPSQLPLMVRCFCYNGKWMCFCCWQCRQTTTTTTTTITKKTTARLGCVINRIQLENCVILDWWWAVIHKIVSHCSQYLHCWFHWFSAFLSISIFNDTTNANGFY